MVGPTIGGWLYEAGGIRAAVSRSSPRSRCRRRCAFVWLDLPARARRPRSRADRTVLRVPAVAVVRRGGRRRRRDDRDARAGAAAVPRRRRSASVRRASACSSASAPSRRRSCTRLSDGWPIAGAARRLTLIGLVLVGVRAAVLSRAWSYQSAIAFLCAGGGDGRAGHHAVAGLHGRSDVDRRRRIVRRRLRRCTTWPGAPACSAARRSAASCSSGWASRALTLVLGAVRSWSSRSRSAGYNLSAPPAEEPV